jgi:signal transduction histidine kinase
MRSVYAPQSSSSCRLGRNAPASGIGVALETWGLERNQFPEEVETALFRLVQEALTNVSRHAKATQVNVIVQCTAQHAVVSVEDDGIGFDPETVPEGHFGLIGMRERLSLCSGTLEIESAPGSGSTILARVPLRQADQEQS